MKRLYGWILAFCILCIGVYFMTKKKPVEVKEVTELLPYTIFTQSLGSDNESGSELTKRGKIKGSSEVIVNATLAGKVSIIKNDIGSQVGENMLVVGLEDTYNTYGLNAQKAQVGVQSAETAYKQQLESLNNQLTNAQLVLERTEIASETTISDAIKQLEQANYSLNNTINTPGSATSLQIEKLEKELKKAQFDYETALKGDEQTIDNFLNNAKNIWTDITLLHQDVMYETDKILGITDQNKGLNDTYEAALSASNTQYLFNARDVFYTLQRQTESLKNISANSLTADTMATELQQWANSLGTVQNMLDIMEKVLTHTTAGGSISQGQLDGLKGQFDGYQVKAQGTISAITAQINGINTFLRTYKDQQLSRQKSIDLLEEQITITKKNFNDAQFNAQVGYDRTKLGSDLTQKNADLDLKNNNNTIDYLKTNTSLSRESLQNAIKQAKINAQEAQIVLEKLSVKSPIQGTITDLFVDEGQDVNPGTPLFRVVSETQEIEITLLAHETQYVSVGQDVIVMTEDQKEIKGTIVAVSILADSSGAFPIKIQLKSNEGKVGTFADVKIPLHHLGTTLPLNSIKIVDNRLGEIFVLEGTGAVKKTVQLGNLIGENIEIMTDFGNNIKIITSNLDAFDPERMYLQVQGSAQHN